MIAHGFYRSLPLVLGYFPIGFAFGVLAANTGLAPWECGLMSLFVYAGSSQLIAVSLLAAGAGILTITLTTFLVNLRHILMSATLAPYLDHFSRLQQALFAYQFTDEIFALYSVTFPQEKIPDKAGVFTTNLVAHGAWIGSSTLGAWAGTTLTGSPESWGLDYALPAMFIALLVLQLDNRRHIFIAFFSAALSLLLFWKTSGHWHIIIATLCSATLGLFLEKTPAETL
ncbi:MAG: AzlC family ABC transporter permease [Dethiobacteria bacterium]|jgi:4-azaleucine resistance transporter AzlC